MAKVFLPFPINDVAESPLSLFTQVCEMWMRSRACWRRPCCAQHVRTPSLSGRPVTISIGRCRGESYQQQPNFHCVKRGGKNETPFQQSLARPDPREKKVGEKRLRIIDKGCSISDLSLPSPQHCLSVCSHVGPALQGCLCLFNYYNSGPPADCLHLPLSEVRERKNLEETRSNLPNGSEIDPSC